MAEQIVPDTKDWTWVLERACPECGFDPAGVALRDLAGRIARSADGWDERLARPDASRRPRPDVWAPVEYACHVRDVHRLFAERLGLMLAEDDPQFANWDQDVTAIEERYAGQDPVTVAADLVTAAGDVAECYAGIGGSQWERRGTRSNGSVFTVATLGAYHLHDVVHHRHDVGLPVGEA